MAMQCLTIDGILELPDGTNNFGWPEMVELTMAVKPVNWPIPGPLKTMPNPLKTRGIGGLKY